MLGLCHTTLEGDPAIFIEDALCGDKPVHALVGVLVDERPQLGLNLELYPPACDLLHVLVVDGVDKEEVSHVLGQLLNGFNTGDAGLPRTQYVLGIGLGGGRRLADAGVLISLCLWRRLAASGGIVLAVDMGMESLLENKVGVGRQFLPQSVDALGPDWRLEVPCPPFPGRDRRRRLLDAFLVATVDLAGRRLGLFVFQFAGAHV